MNDLPATRHAFTFGCLNHPGKLSDARTETWAAILKAVPQYRVWCCSRLSPPVQWKHSQAVSQNSHRFQRLEIINRLPESDYLPAYQPIDLALDPFPLRRANVTHFGWAFRY